MGTCRARVARSACVDPTVAAEAKKGTWLR